MLLPQARSGIGEAGGGRPIGLPARRRRSLKSRRVRPRRTIFAASLVEPTLKSRRISCVEDAPYRLWTARGRSTLTRRASEGRRALCLHRPSRAGRASAPVVFDCVESGVDTVSLTHSPQPQPSTHANENAIQSSPRSRDPVAPGLRVHLLRLYVLYDPDRRASAK